jgi:uncharacterized protein (TIGR00299 family) protein
MRILYFDCFSGISGDMAVGALRDLGVDESVFVEAWSALGLNAEFSACFRRDVRQHVAGWKFDVLLPEFRAPKAAGLLLSPDHEQGRTYREIRDLLANSSLASEIKNRAIAVFHRIAVAEGRIHGLAPEEVGFHEVGAIDSIVDIVAACAGLHALQVDAFLARPLFEGTGWISCAHGKFPLPAPATLEILKGIPLTQIEEPLEYITPTGAAILAEYVTEFGPLPEMRVQATGYGLGSRKTQGRPNALRLITGDAVDEQVGDRDEIVEIQTNLDDMTPELIAAAVESLWKAGALDVFQTPVQMKKGRMGIVLHVLASPRDREALTEIIFRETSAFGIRTYSATRVKLRRQIVEVQTAYGAVAIKMGEDCSGILKLSPEYESCRLAAQASRASVQEVYLAAVRAAEDLKNAS